MANKLVTDWTEFFFFKKNKKETASFWLHTFFLVKVHMYNIQVEGFSIFLMFVNTAYISVPITNHTENNLGKKSFLFKAVWQLYTYMYFH